MRRIIDTPSYGALLIAISISWLLAIAATAALVISLQI
jgi:hypothetical protein